jgi:hypothetical protein
MWLVADMWWAPEEAPIEEEVAVEEAAPTEENLSPLSL